MANHRIGWLGALSLGIEEKGMNFLRGTMMGAALLGITFLCCPLAAAAGSGTLTDARIAEANKPGTVMIYTIWTTTLSIPEPKVPPERIKALKDFAERQAQLGLIQDRPAAKNKAMLEELVRQPLEYLVPEQNSKTLLDVHTAASGSGFILAPDGYILTNEHVVDPGNEAIKYFVIEGWQGNELKDRVINDAQGFARLFHKLVGIQSSGEMVGQIVQAYLRYYLANAHVEKKVTQVFALMGVAIPGLPTQPKGIPCDVRKHGEVTPGKDVAILKMEQTNVPTVPVGDDTILNIGDHIVVLGYPGVADMGFMEASQPKGVEATLTQGDLSARKTMPGGWSALQTSAEINHGNSGGPAFNDKGEVIGIATFGPEAKGINFLVPMSVAKQFLDELNIRPQQSRLSRLYQEGLAQFDKHCYKGALEKFKEVGDLSPGFPFVQSKITQSRVAIDQGLDHCWIPSPAYIAAAVTVLLIALTGAWFLMRRRGAPAVASVPVAAGAAPPTARVGGYQADGGPTALPATAAAAPAPARTFGMLQCMTGPLQGRRFEISKQGLLIGRDAAKCQIVLTDDAISKEHAWIVPLDDGVFVIDRGSANGVFINSVESPRISKVRLQDRDQIYLGKKGTFVFSFFSH